MRCCYVLFLSCGFPSWCWILGCPSPFSHPPVPAVAALTVTSPFSTPEHPVPQMQIVKSRRSDFFTWFYFPSQSFTECARHVLGAELNLTVLRSGVWKERREYTVARLSCFTLHRRQPRTAGSREGSDTMKPREQKCMVPSCLQSSLPQACPGFSGHTAGEALSCGGGTPCGRVTRAGHEHFPKEKAPRTKSERPQDYLAVP